MSIDNDTVQSKAEAHGAALAENDFAGWRVLKSSHLPRIEAAHELPEVPARGPFRWQFTIVRDDSKLITHVLGEPLQEVTL